MAAHINNAHHRWSVTSSLRAMVAALLLLSVTCPPTLAQTTSAPRFIVKWKADSKRTRAQALSNTGDEIHNRTGMNLKPRRNLNEHMDVLQLDRDVSVSVMNQTLTDLNAQDDVEYAVLDQRRHALGILPDDPLVAATTGRTGQWYLLNSEPASINAFEAWDYSQGGSMGNGVIVAVIDTGVRYDHPDLAGKLLPGYDFVDCEQNVCSGSGLTFLTANDGDGWDADASDPGDWVSSLDMQNHPSTFDSTKCEISDSSWHGTRVAGIIGAATNNKAGIAGIGWNARILPVRVLGKCGGWDSDIIAGMRWAAGLPVSGAPANPNPAKVINLSLGSASSCNLAYTDAINQIRAAGVSVVASAGNDSAKINTPANCSGVIAVVGVRNTGTKVGFSSLGTEATIAAPAGNCINGGTGPCLFSLDTTVNLGTTNPGQNDYTDQYNYNLGTSFSAPIVSGTIALMLGARPDLTPDHITSILRNTATPFPSTAANSCTVPTSNTSVSINESECNCTGSTCGAGMVNAYQAVLAATNNAFASSSSVSSSAATSASTKTSTNSSGGGGSLGLINLLILGWLSLLQRTAKLPSDHQS